MTAPAETPPAGDVAAPEANAAPTGTPAPSPANMPQTQPPVAAAPTAEKPEEATGEPQESPDLAKLRKENATWRTKLREQEQVAANAQKAAEEHSAKLADLEGKWQKLNAFFNPDANEPPDPAKLAEQLTAAQAENARIASEWEQERKTLKVQAALPGVLAKANADPGLTEAVLATSGALAKLDPTSDSFAADLASAVNEAIEANPRLKIEAPAARSPRSGAEIPGRSGGSTQLTLDQVRGMKPDEINKARKEGRLTSLGIGPG
jgi:hypothetical protein